MRALEGSEVSATLGSVGDRLLVEDVGEAKNRRADLDKRLGDEDYQHVFFHGLDFTVDLGLVGGAEGRRFVDVFEHGSHLRKGEGRREGGFVADVAADIEDVFHGCYGGLS